MSEELLIAQQEVYRLKDRLGMLSALHKGCSGIQAENARLREQADALAGALEATKQTAGQLLVLKEATGVIPADLAEVFVSRACEMAAAALRAYRECDNG